MRVFATIRAAELRTRCNFSVVFLGAPIRIEAAAIIDPARDERMNECSDRVVIQRTSDASCGVVVIVERST